jgi:hypothetical protein
MPTLRSTTKALHHLDETFRTLLSLLSDFVEGGVDGVEVAENASEEDKRALLEECLRPLQEFIMLHKPGPKRKRFAPS